MKGAPLHPLSCGATRSGALCALVAQGPIAAAVTTTTAGNAVRIAIGSGSGGSAHVPNGAHSGGAAAAVGGYGRSDGSGVGNGRIGIIGFAHKPAERWIAAPVDAAVQYLPLVRRAASCQCDLRFAF